MDHPNEPEASVLPPALGRRNAIRLLTGAAAGCLINGMWYEPGSLSVTRRDVRCERLPSGLEGLRIGLLADFHYRPDDDAALIGKVVSKVREEKLDLVLLTGDFVDSDPAVLSPLMEHLGRITATHGVFAVMGNHDGWNTGVHAMKRGFEAAGISFLVNRHSLLSIRGETLAVAGTDFVWLGKPDPVRTLRGVSKDTPVIAMVHEPDYFDVMAAQRDILLQVSGHTHGGQCRVPLLGYAPVKVEHGRKYEYGGYSRGGSNLFVTRGVGTTGPRVRFACPPELAVLTLRSGAARG